MNHFITSWGDGLIYFEAAEVVSDDMQYRFRLRDKGEEYVFILNSSEIRLININKRVVTVFIDIEFIENAHSQSFQIVYGDEEDSYRRTATFYVINGAPETQYVTLQTCGKVSYIRLIYPNETYVGDIKEVVLNKPVPLNIFWPRVLLFFSAIFLGLIIKRRKLFFLALDEHSVKQKALTAGIIAGFVLYLFGIMLLARPFSTNIPFVQNFENDGWGQYNAEVVDALLDGRVYLDYEPTEALLSLANPYDKTMRDAADPEAPFDYTYYNGKFYSYFGIVQVLILALPYKLITGSYIPTRVAVFIFASLASIFLMLLWRRLVFRFIKDMPLGMYALGQLAVAMCSMVTFLMAQPYFYEVAGTSAMAFTALGLWLILGSIKDGKIVKIPLSLGCLSMALAVGCRPNYLFASFLVPVLLFGHMKTVWRDKKQRLILCAYVGLPYIVIGCVLMWYNYIRFESVFEFGNKYMLGGTDLRAHKFLNPIGKLSLIIASYACYFLPSFKLGASFPFVSLQNVNITGLFNGFIYIVPVLGLLTLPITWFTFGLGCIKKQKIGGGGVDALPFNLIASMLLLGLFQIAIGPLLAKGIVTRYELDFFWLFVFPSLICAYFLHRQAVETSLRLGATVQNIICFSIVVSVALIFLLTLSGGGETDTIWLNNPAAYYYIQRLLGFDTW